MRQSIQALALAAVALLALAGCDPAQQGGAVVDRKIRVTATVGMVADTARRVGGDRVEVTSLMGPGIDPHMYKASQGDLDLLEQADLILYNGFNLEGKMGEIFAQISSQGKPTVAVAEGIDKSILRRPPEFKGHYDPHVWFDVKLWSETVPPVVKALSDIDPPSAEKFAANAKAYQAELAELDAWCREELATVPQRGRVLVTAHDAFGYFGRAYDVEVVGLQGISTASEYGPRDIQKLVQLITTRSVKAVFVESSVPRRSIEAVVAGCAARGHAVKIGGTLFSDAMGEAGTEEGTYPGMVRHNVRTIVRELK